MTNPRPVDRDQEITVRFDVFTIFPGIFDGPLSESILKRAQAQGLISVHLHDIRAWATDRHRSVDDYPYGGGPGMVMMAPPVVSAVEAALGDDLASTPVILMAASGEILTHDLAVELARAPRLAIICGHYEGVDERVRVLLKTRNVSIGDYVLTGGEIAATVIIDVVARLVPGVIDEESLREESHTTGLLEYPHYTRPPEFRGLRVPDVLLSGHHARIADWRRQQSLCRTRALRPDLLARAALSPRDRRLLEECPEAPEDA